MGSTSRESSQEPGVVIKSQPEPLCASSPWVLTTAWGLGIGVASALQTRSYKVTYSLGEQRTRPCLERETGGGKESEQRERETGSQRGDCPSPGLGVGRGKGKLFPSSPLGPLVGESVGTGSRSSGPPKVAERDLGQKPRSAEAGTERVTRPLGALWVWGSHSDRAWLPAGSSEAPFSEASPELQSLNPPQTQSLWVGESHLPTSQSGKLRHDEASEAPGVLGAES